MKSSRKKGAGIAFMILLLALTTRIFVMLASCAYIPVTSDESITVLQSRHIASGEPDLFVWAQPYQFPVEAYLMAPISKLLPGNAFGARFQSFIIAILSLAAMIMILRRMALLRNMWPALLLVLFPSAYLTMIQFGYPIPHYTSAFLFWWLAVLSALYMPLEVNRRSLALVGLTGLFCGLAFTNNMVSLAFVVPITIVVCFGMGLRRMLWNAPVFAAGGFVGLLPYLAGIWRYPDAQVAVAGTRALSAGVNRFWNPTISYTFPKTMGISPGLFPDSDKTLAFGEWLAPAFSVLFLLMLIYATVLCVIRIFEQLSGKKWPSLTINEIFLGAAWLGIILFLLSKRADGHSYRYLTPVAWSFPFILYYVYNGVSRRIRGLIAILVLFLAAFNLIATLKLAVSWSRPDYAVKAVAAPDLKPALGFLKEKGIKYCYASHWAAYRISFLSDGEVICSQPYNERFPGWLVPNKEKVDAAENAAYVLTEDIRFMKPNIFERHMRTMQVTSKREICGRFVVYYDFEQEFADQQRAIPFEQLSVTAADDVDMSKICDGNMDTFWRTDRLQEKDMYVEVTFPGSRPICGLEVYCGHSYNDRPKKYHVEIKTPEGWKVVGHKVFNVPDKFRFAHGHPVYGEPFVQTIRLVPLPANGIRLVIDEPDPNWAWTINEIVIFEAL